MTVRQDQALRKIASPHPNPPLLHVGEGADDDALQMSADGHGHTADNLSISPITVRRQITSPLTEPAR